MPLRRALSRLLLPTMEWVISRWSVDDPWKRMSIPAGPAFSRREFRWYLEGDSLVSVTSIEDVCTWLRQCEHAEDVAPFDERDMWQHPRKFEYRRRGDCQDHALWAWRQLVKLGVDAEFVCGRWNARSPDAGDHAWVLVRDASGIEYILESVVKDDHPMVQAAVDVRAQYIPHFAVNRDLRTVTFHGYILEVQRRRQQRRL